MHEDRATARRRQRQRITGALGGATEQLVQAGLQHVPRITPDQAGAAEVQRRAAVGGHHRAAAVERHQALVEGMQQLAPAVQAHQVQVAVPRLEEAVLDGIGRHADEHAEMLGAQIGFGSDVEHADQRVALVEDRRRAAGQPDQAGEEMLGAIDDQRTALGQAGADAVGAAGALAPVATGTHADARRLAHENAVAKRLQHGAVGVGDHHQGVAVRKLAVEAMRLGTGAGKQVGVAFLAGFQPVARQPGQGKGSGGIQAVVVDAAMPRTGDKTRLSRQAIAHRSHDEVGMPPGREIQHCFRPH